MKKFTFTMRIILALFCIAAVVIWSAFFKMPDVPTDVEAKVLSVLEQMSARGIKRLDDQIVAFDRQLRDIEGKKAELEQILPQTEKWIAAKKILEYDDACFG